MSLGPAAGKGRPGRGEKVSSLREVRCDSAEQRGQSRASSSRSKAPEEGRRGGGIGHGRGPGTEGGRGDVRGNGSHSGLRSYLHAGRWGGLQASEPGSDPARPGLGGGGGQRRHWRLPGEAQRGRPCSGPGQSAGVAKAVTPGLWRGRGRLSPGDLSNEMLSVSSQRVPWVGLAEPATGSGHAGLAPGRQLIGAGLRRSGRRREKKPRRGRGGHAKVTHAPGTGGGSKRRRGKWVRTALPRSLPLQSSGKRGQAPQKQSLMLAEPGARGAPRAAPPRGRGGLNYRPRPRAASPWLWLHLPAGRAVDPPGLLEGTG